MAEGVVSSSDDTDCDVLSEPEDNPETVATAPPNSSTNVSPSTSSLASPSSSIITPRRSPRGLPLSILTKHRFLNERYQDYLMQAVTDRNADFLQSCLNTGMDVNFKSRDLTPLMYAASIGESSIVSLLLQKGADVNARTRKGNSALHFASSDRQGLCIALLIDAGANISYKNAQGYTALHYAASASEACVRKLLNAGAAKYVRNRAGDTPYSLAKTDSMRNILRP